MAGSPTPTDCPFDDSGSVTGIDAVDLDAQLTDQFGEYDAFGAFSDRDSYPGPP